MLLQFTKAFIITNYDNVLLQFTIARLLPRQLLLQFTAGITIHDIITIHERKHDACSPSHSLCTDRPLSSIEIGERPLLRFLLRGGGSVHRLPSPSIYVFPYFRSVTSNSRHLELFPWKVRLIGSRPYFFTF